MGYGVKMPTGSATKERNYAVDALRLIAAFAVVFIHVAVTDFGLGNFDGSKISIILNAFTKLAVPLFFAISGFFLYRASAATTSNRAFSQALKIGALLLLSIGLWVVFKLCIGQPIVLTPQVILNFVLFNDTEQFGPHLWFLSALAYALFIIFIALKLTHRLCWVIIVSALAFLYGLSQYTYGHFFHVQEASVIHYRNFLFFGLPFLALGLLIAKYVERIRRISSTTVVKLTVFALILYIIEYFALGGGLEAGDSFVKYDIYLFLLPVTACIMLLAVRHSAWLSRTPLPDIGKDYAVYIYIAHPILMTLIFKFIIHFSVKVDSVKDMLIVYLITCLLSLGVAVLYVKVKKRFMSNRSQINTALTSLYYWLRGQGLVLMGGLLGLIMFVSLFGFGTLNPFNDSWIFNSSGDLKQHYTGWQYYRDAPWHPLNLGKIDGLAHPFGISFVYLDVIPLFAIFFKIFNSILPETFQYLGLFTAMSFVLQGSIAALIFSRFTKNSTLVMLGSIFLLATPILFGRVFAHTALTAHWLILLSIYLLIRFAQQETRLRYQIASWTALLSAAVLVHPYFIPIVGSIFALSIIQQHKSFKQSAIRALLPVTVMLIIFVLIGGLASGLRSAGGGGLGLYSYNLLSPIIPLGYSAFFGSTFTSLQWEGLGYLGLGLLPLLPVVWFLWLQGRRELSITAVRASLLHGLRTRKVLYVACMGAVLLLSLSPLVYLGGILVVTVPVPHAIESVWAIFRSTGRLSWPLQYLAVVGLLAYLFKSFGQGKEARLLVLFLLPFALLQTVDVALSSGVKVKQEAVSQSLTTHNPNNLNATFITDFCNKERVVIVDNSMDAGILVSHELPDYILTCKPALTSGYFARAPEKNILGLANENRTKLVEGSLTIPDSDLYLTVSEDFAKEIDQEAYITKQYDTFWVITNR